MVTATGTAGDGERPEPGVLETLVISVDPPDGPRRKSAHAQLDGIGWRFRFVDGFASGSPEAMALYSPRLNRKHSKRPLTGGEIAAYASHRRALQMFLDSGARFGLILEDDFGLVAPGSFPRQIEAVLKTPISWNFIKLFDYQPGPISQRRAAGDLDIVSYAEPGAGMVAYLVSRSGAQKFLSRKLIFRQIDEDTKFYWEFGIRVLSASPNPVTEISDRMGGSLIEAERLRLRTARTLRRSLKGLRIVIDRQLRHLWHRRRYGIEDS